MDSLRFFKMSASGNDFIVIDNREGVVASCVSRMWPIWSQGLPQAPSSVGADGVILIENSDEASISLEVL